MNRLEEAKIILQDLGMEERQQTDLCGFVLLALAHIGPDDSWEIVSNEWIRVHDIIAFITMNYGKVYAENSRETIRKQALHYFRDKALIEDNGKPTNSPNYKYRLTSEFKDILQTFASDKWKNRIKEFSETHRHLINFYALRRMENTSQITINGKQYTLSTGAHNKLQKAIIEEFLPRFAPDAQCMYLGDTKKKDLVFNRLGLERLGCKMTIHDKLPDVILYKQDTHWLYFIEAVTSVGPINNKRVEEIKRLSEDSTAGIIFVTAFPDFKTFKKFSQELAWDTEVWISEAPNHMIHMNGDRFLGPR